MVIRWVDTLMTLLQCGMIIGETVQIEKNSKRGKKDYRYSNDYTREGAAELL